MYQRIKKWLQAISPTVHSESVWTNEFTTEEDDVIDIRFRLKGYGWKPNAGDENLSSLEQGSYKIYYKLDGGSTWIFAGRVSSKRANTSDTRVYENVGFTTGSIPEGKYNVKIVADKGAKFTGWGGAIEEIVSGGQFWSGLEVRSLAYKQADVVDSPVITEDVGVALV